MSSDIVKQLRGLAKAEWLIGYGADGNVASAADRIEALEGEVERITTNGIHNDLTKEN